MIKLKSKSKDVKNHESVRFIHKPLHIAYTDNKLLRTVQLRNLSNEIIPSTYSIQKSNSIKRRQFSTVKNRKKQSQNAEMDIYPLKKIVYQQRELKKNGISSTFIDSKLKKKLQKYFLFLSIVNYSIRICYQNPEIKRYKIFVGKGNNSRLIKLIFANRFWWSFTNAQNEANLIWTQKSKKKIFKNVADFIKNNEAQQTQKQVITKIQKLVKMKYKKKDSKKIFIEEGLDAIICEEDKLNLKQQCRIQYLMEDIKQYLKKVRCDKRKYVKVTHNHLQNHRILTHKKQLFHNLQQFCHKKEDNVFNYIPLTFHFQGQNDLRQLVKYEQGIQSRKEKDKLMWIIKPGQNSNRGCDIWVTKRIENIKIFMEKQQKKHPQRTFIIQKYINPFLFHRRKFDIRCFALVTATPTINAYFYPIGYIRTSCFEFSMKNCSNKYIHLTNDAVQKKAIQYSKYQMGNKVRFEEFQKYLNLFHADKKINFFTEILPALKELVLISIKAAKNFNESCKQHTFELLGYDFMIDQDMHPWLIEVNTNPCLDTDCQILNDIIPAMIENVIKIAIDPVFKPPKIDEWSLNNLLTCSDSLLERNKFELIYSQLHDQR